MVVKKKLTKKKPKDKLTKKRGRPKGSKNKVKPVVKKKTVQPTKHPTKKYEKPDNLTTAKDIRKMLEESKENPNELFYNALVSVYEQDPFWGRILSRIRKRKDYAIPTMAACFDRRTGRFEVRWNPNFLIVCKELMSNEEYKLFSNNIIKHEVAHIIWGHVSVRAYVEKYHPMWRNICMDVVVNHSVGAKDTYNDKQGAALLKLCTAKGYKWEEGQNTEFYLAKQKKQKCSACGGKGCEKCGGTGDSAGQGQGDVLDDHGAFGKNAGQEAKDSKGRGMGGGKGEVGGDMTVEEQANQEIRRLVREAVNEIRKGRGTIPGGMEERIAAILGGKVNWKRIFKKLLFDAFERSKEKEYTRLRPNKRYGLMHPGHRSIRQGTPPILTGLDVSGSVSSEEIQEYIGEINNLIKSMDAIVDVTSFDTKVGKIIRRARRIAEIDVVGRGGTDYNELVRVYNENKRYKFLVVFTDGYCPPPDVLSKKPIYWFVWGEGSNKQFSIDRPKNRVYFIDTK